MQALRTRAVELGIASSILARAAPRTRIDWQVGSRVFANWSHDEYWSLATIRSFEIEGGRISVQYNYDATTSPDDPAPRVDCSSHFLLPAGWGMQSITHQENLKVWTQP